MRYRTALGASRNFYPVLASSVTSPLFLIHCRGVGVLCSTECWVSRIEGVVFLCICKQGCIHDIFVYIPDVQHTTSGRGLMFFKIYQGWFNR